MFAVTNNEQKKYSVKTFDRTKKTNVSFLSTMNKQKNFFGSFKCYDVAFFLFAVSNDEQSRANFFFYNEHALILGLDT